MIGEHVVIDMDHSNLYTFLAQQKYGVVSSIGPDNFPQSALVGIAVTARLEIIFDTDNASRKFRNLAIRPRCSFVVGWSEEKTVQLEGVASIAAGAEVNDVRAFYLSVWKDGEARAASPNTAYIVVRPVWIRYSDYSIQPPKIEEFDIAED